MPHWCCTGTLSTLVGDIAPSEAPPRPFLDEVDTADFIADPHLHEEVLALQRWSYASLHRRR